MSQKIFKIVLTGGPSGGKTSAISYIQRFFGQFGWTVLIMREVATDVIQAGFKPGVNIAVNDFQRLLITKQFADEKVFERLIGDLKTQNKILVIYDRAFHDTAPYCQDDQFKNFLTAETNLQPNEARDRYDAVIHLVTAADGAPEHYTLENNPARFETASQALDRDRQTRQAWIGHPHFHLVDNSTDFAGKMDRVIALVCQLIGYPIPLQNKHRYLLSGSVSALTLRQNGIESVTLDIITHYLLTDSQQEEWITRRGTAQDGYLYYHSTETSLDASQKIEIERRIDIYEYNNYLKRAIGQPISKQRLCFIYQYQYFQLDIFDGANHGLTILEIESTYEQKQIIFPPVIKIIREITGEKELENHYLAKIL